MGMINISSQVFKRCGIRSGVDGIGNNRGARVLVLVL
jgi:hypothetical protein